MKKTITIAIWILMTGALAAQSNNCDAILVLQVDSTLLTEDVKMAMLKTISEDSYRDIQNQRGMDFSIPGVPVSFSGNYGQFDEQRRKYLESHKFNMERRHALSIVRSFLQKEQVSAWMRCKELTARSSSGIHCWIIRESSQSVTIAFLWNPVPDARQQGKVASTLRGGRSQERGVAKGKAFRSGFQFRRTVDPIQITFDRNDKEEFDLRVNVNGAYEDGVYLLAPQKPVSRVWLDLEDIFFSYLDIGSQYLHKGYNFRLSASANAVTNNGTEEARTVFGVHNINGDGSNRVGTSQYALVTQYRIGMLPLVEVNPGDQLIRIQFFLSLEAGGIYTTEPDQFTITLEKKGEHWIATPSNTSSTLKGFYPPGVTRRFQGEVRYSVHLIR